MAPARRILGIVDSDSYVKWGAATLSALGEGWHASLVIIDSRLAASDAQVVTALTGTRFETDAVPRASLQQIVARLNAERPDAVFVSTSGAVAEAVIAEITLHVHPRPVLMTGLPGISSPAKYKGLFRRAQADLFVLHSHREVREYGELARERGIAHRFVLSTLPFLTAPVAESAGGRTAARDSIVFAAQPSVPYSVEDRRRVVQWLEETARRHPRLRVVIKVRALAGERQTHHERHPYAELLSADAPANLVVAGGGMGEHLVRAVGLVTVSSTAAIEAVAAGVPVLVLSDFGVTARLINQVFIGSGLLGSSRDLVAGRFGSVRETWRRENYFHDAGDDDWQHALGELALAREAGGLPPRPAVRRSHGGWLRRAWERKRAFGSYDTTVSGYAAAAIGYPYLGVRRTARAVLTRMRGGEPMRPLEQLAHPTVVELGADPVTEPASRG